MAKKAKKPKRLTATKRQEIVEAIYGEAIKPVHLNKDQWFYAGPDDLTVGLTIRGTLQSIVGHVRIPWRKLEDGVAKRKRFLRRVTTAEQG